MGGKSSRLAPRPPPRPPIHHHHHHHRRPSKRSLSSFFVCGGAVSSFFICGASSSTSPSEIEDDPAELLVNSAENGALNKFRTPRKDSALASGTGPRSTSPISEIANDTRQFGNGSGDAESSNTRKHSSKSKQLVSDHSSGETSSSSNMDQRSRDSVSASGKADIYVNGANISVNRDMCTGLTHHGSPSSNELGESSSDESSAGICGTAVMAFPNYDSSSASVVSDSPLNNHMSRDNTFQEVSPTGSRLVVSERGQGNRDGNSLHVDVASVSSTVISSSSSEINNERRNSRRSFWDALSRRSRGYADSRSYLFADDDSDILGHQDRWLLDFSGDFLGEGVGGDFRSYGSRARGNYDRRLHSRSEILERIRGGLDGDASRTALCPTGIHPEGSCSCESILRAEESGSRTSISRVVMLAEALFEVLDEIHRQPVSVPFPAVSLPAPESVVNSFPERNYRKPERIESSDDVAKCHICLAEYEQGDKIRVLPCHHEYHTSCIDKWLKEIHGVCPLCRADVREGFDMGAASAPEIHSR